MLDPSSTDPPRSAVRRGVAPGTTRKGLALRPRRRQRRHHRRCAGNRPEPARERLFRTRYSDLLRYNAFWRHCLPHIHVTCAFEVETLINIRVARAACRGGDPSIEYERLSARATSTRSATACVSCARSSANGCGAGMPQRTRTLAPIFRELGAGARRVASPKRWRGGRDQRRRHRSRRDRAPGDVHGGRIGPTSCRAADDIACVASAVWRAASASAAGARPSRACSRARARRGVPRTSIRRSV